MLSLCSTSRLPLRRLAMTATAFAVAGIVSLPALAQTQASGAETYSSSTSYSSYFNHDDLVGNELVSAPEPHANASGQYGNRYPSYPYHSGWNHLAIEAGGGFTAPVGSEVSGGQGEGLDGFVTWGYNITAGAGWNFTHHFGLLAEYQFNRNKIPGATLAALGAPGGNVNTHAFTLDPIIYLPVSRHTGAYLTGGGGLYRKVTNYTAPEVGVVCYYFCYEGYSNTTIYHFSSNQGGANAGIGYYWKLGDDTNARFYAEARYVWVNSPRPSPAQPLAEGSEELIPVTFGIRF
jgi:hypothetical protein